MVSTWQSGGQVMEKDRMENEGWKLATTASGEHLNRTLEMYNELGFDVYAEEVAPGQDPGDRDVHSVGRIPVHHRGGDRSGEGSQAQALTERARPPTISLVVGGRVVPGDKITKNVGDREDL